MKREQTILFLVTCLGWAVAWFRLDGYQAVEMREDKSLSELKRALANLEQANRALELRSRRIDRKLARAQRAQAVAQSQGVEAAPVLANLTETGSEAEAWGEESPPRAVERLSPEAEREREDAAFGAYFDELSELLESQGVDSGVESEVYVQARQTVTKLGFGELRSCRCSSGLCRLEVSAGGRTELQRLAEELSLGLALGLPRVSMHFQGEHQLVGFFAASAEFLPGPTRPF